MSDTVLVAVIGAAALIASTVLSTVLSRPSKKRQEATQQAAEMAVQQTKHTGNGFAGEVRAFIKDMREFREHSTAHGEFQDQLLVAIDQRVTNLEENQ